MFSLAGLACVVSLSLLLFYGRGLCSNMFAHFSEVGLGVVVDDDAW